MTKVGFTELTAIASRALDRGGRFSGPASVAWNVSGDCENPRPVNLSARKERRPLEPFGLSKGGKPFQYVNARYDRNNTGQPLWVDIETRCRRCGPCMRARAYQWAQRAIREIEISSRTWFGTLTLSPHEQFIAWTKAQVRDPDIRAASPDKQFIARHEQIAPEITKYLKRVRAASGARLRYLLVAEAHKSGLPHYHILIHEHPSWPAVRKIVLDDEWKLGFTKFKLVQPERRRKAAYYAAKYLTKAAEARVRASLRYGKLDRDDLKS